MAVTIGGKGNFHLGLLFVEQEDIPHERFAHIILAIEKDKMHGYSVVTPSCVTAEEIDNYIKVLKVELDRIGKEAKELLKRPLKR